MPTSSPDQNPEIPNAASFAELSNYLRDKPHFPLSDAIPQLNLGGQEGGICDLQFAIMQLIQRSDAGVNVLQMLSASIHLMLEVEFHFAEQLRRVEAELPPFNDAPQADKDDVARALRALLVSLRTSSGLTESLFSQLTSTFGFRRLEDLRKRGARPITTAELRSYLLISDELLSSLNLDRSPVTEYLDRAAQSE